MKLIFVNYGLFNSNSGGHVAHFANYLAEYVDEILVIGQGEDLSLQDYGERRFCVAQFPKQNYPIPQEILDFALSGDVAVHAWTTRGNVSEFVEHLVAATGVPYFVHLEDNEELLLAANMGMSVDTLGKLARTELDALVPLHLSHPHKATEFMRKSAGVTLIVDTLDKFRPSQVPGYLLEPGVDGDTFAPNLSEDERRALREELYIDSGTTVIAYHGNVHAANAEEIFSLYTSVLLLRRRGYNVVMIRAGRDYVDNMDPSYQYLRGDWVINLGFLDRARLIEVLKLADIFVQPGAPGDFNSYRFPSKLPEFLALGRPVFLPKANIGLRLTDGENAILLGRGDGTDIADKIESVINDRKLIDVISKGARKFAISELSWNEKARGLFEFYKLALA